MEVEIRPEPGGPAEREAILAALEELLVRDQIPASYRSAWRAEGIRENVEDLADEEGSC
jgi:hypothetical protein